MYVKMLFMDEKWDFASASPPAITRQNLVVRIDSSQATNLVILATTSNEQLSDTQYVRFRIILELFMSSNCS